MNDKSTASDLSLRLIRTEFHKGYTLGALEINGVFECWTVEDEVREEGVKVFGQTAIPYGKYKVVIDQSKRFGRLMPHILDVPMFDGIRFHAGNTALDVEGCIAVGDRKVQGGVQFSVQAFDRLFNKLKSAWDQGAEIWIEVTNADLLAKAS